MSVHEKHTSSDLCTSFVFFKIPACLYNSTDIELGIFNISSQKEKQTFFYIKAFFSHLTISEQDLATQR